MRNKIIVLVVIAFVILGGFFFLSEISSDESEIKKDVVNNINNKEVENNINSEANVSNADVSNTISNSYSFAEIATHNNEKDCFTIVDGSVYDVTSWIPNHPGGKQAIIGLCGKDGSSAFTNKHGGQERPVAELAKFKIGTLK